MKIQGQAFSLNSNYQKSRMALAKSMSRLSTGDKYATLGSEPAAPLSMAVRFRHKVARASASINTIERGLNYLNTATEYIDTARGMLHRMQEIATTASDDLKSQADRDGLNVEFQSLKAEFTAMARTGLWNGFQTAGRDAMLSYDANDEKMHFWLPDGSGEKTFTREFGSNAVDSLQQKIGFDSSSDFSMSRDGKSLYFLGTVTGDAAGVRRVKRYDIDKDIVYTGTDLYDSADKLFVNEDGDVYLNDDGTLTTIDKYSLTSTATAVTDLSADQEFSVYKDEAYYFSNGSTRFVKEDINTSTVTNLSGVTTYGAGDHSVSASGRYAAEEDSAGQIRVIDLQTGNEATLAIGAANTVVNLQFNEDGDRVYYIDQTTNSINYISVRTDEADAVQLTAGEEVAQGLNNNSFLGLDLGGANFGSSIKTTVVTDAPTTLWYESSDLRLYALGLTQSNVSSYSAANTAIEDIRTALNRVNVAGAKLGGAAVRFEHMLSTQQNYISDMSNAASQLRDVDMAKESTMMSQEQVKMAAAQAILAQFNHISRNVLSLLQ